MGRARLACWTAGVLLSSWASVAAAQTPAPQPAPAPAPPAPGTAPPAAAPATAPAPAPAAPATYPQQPAPAYPPPAYPQPAYPPPAYAVPALPPAPRYPEDAATQASPFFDALLLGAFADQRFSDALMFGGQVGGYLGGRVRLTLRLVLPTDAEDNTSYSSSSNITIGYNQRTELPNLLYGATVGVVVTQRTKFLFSPGFTINRTDQGDYGTIIGANFPFEWVMRGGVRFGFEAAIGRGLGGSVRYECIDTSGFCTPGNKVSADRDSGIVFMIGFQVGYGLGYPDPEAPAQTEPAPAPYAAPPPAPYAPPPAPPQ